MRAFESLSSSSGTLLFLQCTTMSNLSDDFFWRPIREHVQIGQGLKTIRNAP